MLGIDGGGSKTVCYLADADGAIIGTGRGGGANLQAQGELEVEKVLHGVIEQAIGERSIHPDAACLGVAGADREDDYRVLRDVMRRLGFRRTLIVNDALIALVAGVGDAPGVVLIAGTGSIAYGLRADGLAARSGGWGSVLGDEGSGYWIGRHALAAVMREADGRGAKTQLTTLLLEHFGLAEPSGLVREIYEQRARAGPARFQRQTIAALAPTIARAHADGDVVASEILSQAAEELTRAAASVIERLGMRGSNFPTVLAGGLFSAVPWLADEVTGRLGEVAPRTTVVRLGDEPARGAVHLARRDLQEGYTVPRYLDSAGNANNLDN